MPTVPKTEVPIPPLAKRMTIVLVLVGSPPNPIAYTSTGWDRITCQIQYRLYPELSRIPKGP